MQCLTRTQEFIGECIEQGLNLHDLEREFIVVALERAKDKRVAAKQVGVCMQTLYKKVRKFQIKRLDSFAEFQKQHSLESAQKLGQLIRRARLMKEIEPKELAYVLGYKTSSSISHIEQGRKAIPKRLIPKVSQVLEIPLSELQEALAQIHLERGDAA